MHSFSQLAAMFRLPSWPSYYGLACYIGVFKKKDQPQPAGLQILGIKSALFIRRRTQFSPERELLTKPHLGRLGARRFRSDARCLRSQRILAPLLTTLRASNLGIMVIVVRSTRSRTATTSVTLHSISSL